MGCSTHNSQNKQDMSFVDGGWLHFGSANGSEGQSPVVDLFVNPFFMDKWEVTNGDFQKFVNETNHITSAEKLGSSMIYDTIWQVKKGLAWNNTGLEETSEFNEMPVVHVSWYDAKAYCDWKNKRLPTEQEFEFVMETSTTKEFNIWQGEFPNKNTLEDGFLGAAPVGHFKPNSLGIYDLSGNVWEWTQDNYNYNIHNILSVSESDTSSVWLKATYDPGSADAYDTKKVIKGGSFLCHDSYCSGYKPEARMPAKPKSSYFHLGFRCACDL